MLSGTPAPSSNRTCSFPAYGSPCGSLYSSLPFPEPFQYRFTLVTTASFNLDKRFAARRIICGLPPLTALSGNIFLILMSFAFLFHAEALRSTVIARFPATMASSDSSLRFRYNEVSRVPLLNFPDTRSSYVPRGRLRVASRSPSATCPPLRSGAFRFDHPSRFDSLLLAS